MSDPAAPADLSRVRTFPLAARAHKVSLAEFARPVDPRGTVAEFLDGLPKVLGAESIRGLASAVVAARGAGRPVLFAMGAHVIKVGLAPVLIQLIDAGLINGIAVNGACAIHDWEIAAVGGTSEDVAGALHHGRFGMAEETGRELNDAAREAQKNGRGFGDVLGERISTSALPHRDMSLLGRAYSAGVPVTIHVAVGSDVVHQHPRADGASIGAATFTDFRRLVTLVSGLSGGVWINCGSAVQLPEVFLKALSIAQNLGVDVSGFVTANLDMIRHYRTDENVLRRPTFGRGTSFSVTGQHEIILPLLAASIFLEQSRRAIP